MVGNALYICQYVCECAVVLVDIVDLVIFFFGGKSNGRNVREVSHKKMSFLTPTVSRFGCIQFTKDFSESLKGFYSGANLVVNFLSTFSHFRHSHEWDISVADHK